MYKKKIIWGITGSISIYKTLDILNQLKDHFDIQVIMTESALKFINAIIFETITGKPIKSNLFTNSMVHTQLIQSADIFAIIPATYNIIGKISSGIADDLLTTLASLAGNNHNLIKIIAPAMNSWMFKNFIFQKNLKILNNYNQYKIIYPDYGQLACGDIGIGKLAKQKRILNLFLNLKQFKANNSFKFKNKNILITIGGVFEKIDPIRYIGNLSSGKMGIALAKAFNQHGAKVEIIYGNISTKLPQSIPSYPIYSTLELLALMQKKIENIDILIMCAAISDYRVKTYSPIKLDKNKLKLEFVLNYDILKILGKIKKKNQLFIGFSAGSGNINNQIEKAKEKLINKNLDMIIQNPIDKENIGINSDYNEINIITKNNKPIHIQKKLKKKISFDILNIIHEFFF